MPRLLKTRPVIAVLAFIVGATVAAGVAWAAIPSSVSGAITACYPTSGSKKGALRVIDYQTGARCGRGEAMVRWQSAGMRWRGAWSSTPTYWAGDVVAHAGSSFVATRTGTGVTPPNATYWALMAAMGATGPSGVALCGGYPHANVDWSIPGSTPGNGCNLHLANLDNMRLDSADLTNADLFGAHLVNANLHSAQLTGANLLDANLTGANLITAHLNNATVSGANMTDANLSNASFFGATVTAITWSNTTCPDGTVSDTNGSSPESCIGHGGGL
jgi:hypothetical protein